MLVRPPALFGNAFPVAPRSRSRRAPTRWRSGPEGTEGNARQRVLLDGEPVPTAFVADAIEGYVRAYLPSDDGQLEVRTLHGDVRIVRGD